MASSNKKRQRKSKRSQGIHGATRHKLTEVQKVLLSKGIFKSFKPMGG